MQKNIHVPLLLTKFRDVYFVYFLEQVADQSFRFDNYLDLVICSKFLLHCSVLNLSLNGNSDHYSQSLKIFIDKLLHAKSDKTQNVYDFKIANYAKLDD